MKRAAFVLALGCLGVVFAKPAAAQDPAWTLNVGGGFTNPVGDIESRLNQGWHLTVGGGARLTPHVSLIGEFNYNEMGLSRAALLFLDAPDGDARVWSLTVNPRVNFNPGGVLDVYVIGGGGVYRRTIDLASPRATDPILGPRESTRGGLNIGGGLTVRLGQTGVKFFTEARYHHMYTPVVSTAFVPVTFGLQW